MKTDPSASAPFAPYQGFGLGLRPDHYPDVLAGRASVSWFEVVTENFLEAGGRPVSTLEKVRRDFPIAMHGVSMALGSTDPLNRDYLKRLKAAIKRFEPFVVSDHCCWTGVDGQNFHDLLPMPFTRQAVRHLADRVSRVQDFLGRRILLENLSSYLAYRHDEMPEWDFLREIAFRADCGLLLDVNNIYVSSVNHGFDPLRYLEGIPVDRVGQIHLAGHTTRELSGGQTFLLDTHDAPVCDEVWALYAQAVRRFGQVSTMVEWDAKIPKLSQLELEVQKAQRIAALLPQSDPLPTETPHETIAPALENPSDPTRVAAGDRPGNHL